MTQLTPEAIANRRARLATERDRDKLTRRMVTPEGAVIHLRLATGAERAGAFAIDVMFQWVVAGVFYIALSYTFSQLSTGTQDLVAAIWFVFFFFFRNFYYIFFESGRRAATPGKRLLGLRVASRDGGRLRSDAVLARNFIREIEFGLPLMFLFNLMFGGSSGNGWLSFFGLLWTCVFLFFPVFNRDKMRAGDLIAGTWVVRAPKSRLLSDIAQINAKAPDRANRFAFTTPQTDAYGIHELHVLEDVLRQSTDKIKAEVATRIRLKIGWAREPNETDSEFLEAYYAALRLRLEQRMLLGQRKTDKYDAR